MYNIMCMDGRTLWNTDASLNLLFIIVDAWFYFMFKLYKFNKFITWYVLFLDGTMLDFFKNTSLNCNFNHKPSSFFYKSIFYY